MNVSRRGFLSFLAGAAVPTVLAGGIVRAGGLIKPVKRELVMSYDLGDVRELMLTGQQWFILSGWDEHGLPVVEKVPYHKVFNSSTGNGWASKKKFRSITGIVT